MTFGTLSSVNLIAGAGILGNVGGVPISANSAVINSIDTYFAIPAVTQFANVKFTGASVLTANTAAAELYNLAANVFPALTDAVPVSYISNIGNTPVGGFTEVTLNEINNILGNGDIGIFEQVFASADAFRFSSNQLIDSAVNANNASADATFISQDATMTGGMSQISQAFLAFGLDLLALGQSIDLNNLPNIGSPEALLRQIYTSSNGVPELTTALTQAGIDQFLLSNLGSINMTDEQQKIAFEVMTKITRQPLVQILRLLRVTTTGIVNLADLLNPVKAFPRSFNTLTAPTANGLRAVYINSSGAVNTNLETELPTNVLVPLQGYSITRNTYSQLKKIIPPDWALANKALQAGLQQVKSIFNADLTALSAATGNLETNKGLDLINALTSPLPPEVVAFYENTFVSGSGKNGTVLLADVIGSAAGWVVTANISTTSSIISSLDSAGAFNSLTNGTNGVYTVMQNTLDGDYGTPVEEPPTNIVIPGGLPGAGTYTSFDLAFTGPGAPGTGLIPAAYSAIAVIVSNNANSVANADSAWSNAAAQISGEFIFQSQAGLEFANLIPNQQPTGLVNNLSSYGLDTEVGGPAFILESVANTATLGGQAIVSTMREARNQIRLQSAGVQTEIVVSDIVPQPQATLSSGQYTVAEAVNQKII
jgi:hypothetical protein